jgi:hypothetical protein
MQYYQCIQKLYNNKCILFKSFILKLILLNVNISYHNLSIFYEMVKNWK